MRQIILKKLKDIKKEEDGFSGQIWSAFRIGHILIKDFEPNGLQDEMLVDYYTEVVKWKAMYN
jgi:uncharacterized protein YqkB